MSDRNIDAVLAELLDLCDCDEGCTDCYAAEVIMDLRAERDAARLIINDLTAEVERLRAAGDALAEALTLPFALSSTAARDAWTAWQEARRER